jgi:hypothetical protein
VCNDVAAVNKVVDRSWLAIRIFKVDSFVYSSWCTGVNCVGPPTRWPRTLGGHGHAECETVSGEVDSQPLGRQLTMGQYILRRNGVPAGASGGLRNMLQRSFGARSFAVFWQYWNPVFGYILGRFRWGVRVTANLVYVITCFGLALLVRSNWRVWFP